MANHPPISGGAVSNTTVSNTYNYNTGGANNNVLYAVDYAGADASVKINAALAALPSEGGTVDARGLVGAQTIGTTIAVPAYCCLLLGNATYSTTLLPALTWATSSSVIGSAMTASSGANGTQIFYTATGVAGALMKAASTCFNVTVKNLYLRHTHSASPENDGSIGISTLSTNSSIFRNVYITLFDICWSLGGGSAGSYYNEFFHTQGQTGYTYCYYLGQNANQNALYHPTANSGAVSTLTYYYFHGSAVANSLYNPDAESSSTGALAAFYVNGRANSIYDRYVEGTFTNPVTIDASASFCKLTGGLGGVVTDNSPYWANNVVLAPGVQGTASATSSFTGYPNFFKFNMLKLGATPTYLMGFGAGNTAAWCRVSAITSLSRTSNVVSAVLAGAGFNPGPATSAAIQIVNASPSGATTFNGNFTVASVTDAQHLTYNQTAADDTATGGWAVILTTAPQSL